MEEFNDTLRRFAESFEYCLWVNVEAKEVGETLKKHVCGEEENLPQFSGCDVEASHFQGDAGDMDEVGV